MRNLKKILAMVLALIMSLSLMATAGATDFSDADQIGEDYEVAVEVLNGLGVFKGYDDGARFEPQGKITRAEVAAIIYRIATGDVTDTQKDIYSSWGMFPDVQDENWFAGYVNYCANAGYIKGRSDGKFWPNQEVTGYEALAMILRAVGYDKLGEFTGSNWQVNTASVARERGILKNISSGQLGQSATREMIAEILFRAILVNKVDYTPAYGYQEGSTSVGYDSLGLEDLSGVVEANEYADLYGTAPMKDGQTRLNVDGTKYVLEAGSVLTDIGERRHAYVTDKGANVLYGLYDEKTDYTVAEPDNFGGEGDTVNDVARSANLKLTADTEYYVNFGDPIDKYTSDYRVEYKIGLKVTLYEIMHLMYINGGTAKVGTTDVNVAGTKDGTVDKAAWEAFLATYNRDADVDGDYVYDKVIPVEQEITAIDMKYIKEIFYGSDNGPGTFDPNYDIYFGEVYVATKSQTNNAGESVDISDEISYIGFLDKYINDEFRDFSASDNGEWLKIVDYDNDGNADYVMRTDFVMTTPVDHNTKTDVWFVEYLDYETGLPTEIASADISSKTELAMPTEENMKLVAAKDLVEGQVYMYTYIDGVYYITEPVTVNTSVSKVNYRAGVATCADGADREWSGIDHKAVQYYDDLAEVSIGVNYTLYLDQFGYIRLFTETDKGFVLLTDGYFQTDRRDDAFKAQIWDGDYSDITVNHKNGTWPATSFIWSAADREDNAIYHDDEGTWDRLKEFGHVYYDGENWNANHTDRVKKYNGHWADGDCDLVKLAGNGYFADPYATNIAAYVENDGVYTLGTVDMANSSRAKYEAWAIDNTDMTEGAGNGTVYSDTRTLYGIRGWNEDGTVDTDQNIRIQTTTDTLYYYRQNNGEIISWTGYNSAEAPERFQVSKAYAVGSFVPDRENGDDNTLPYLVAEIVVIEGRYAPTVLAADFLYAMVEGGQRDHYLLGKGTDGYGEKVGKTKNTEYTGLINFYDQAGVIIAPEDCYKYGVYAGRVVTYDRVKGRNYIQVSIDDSNAGIQRDAAPEIGTPRFSFYTDEVDLYNLTQNTAYDGNTLRNFTTRDGSDISLRDYVIFMVDGDGNVGLVINVSESKKTNGDPIDKLDALWDAIAEKQYLRSNRNPARVPFYFYGVNATNRPSINNANIYSVESDTTVSGKTYRGSIYVTYRDAVAMHADGNAWACERGVTVKRWSTGTTWVNGAPSAPNIGGELYVAVSGENYWILVQQPGNASAPTAYTLRSTNQTKAVVNAAMDKVMVTDLTLTPRQLLNILEGTKDGMAAKVNIKVLDKTNNIYVDDLDTSLRSIFNSSDEIWVAVGEDVNASTVNPIQVIRTVTGAHTVTFDEGITRVWDDVEGIDYKSGAYVNENVVLSFTVADGYDLVSVKSNGTTVTPTEVDGVYTITMSTGNLEIKTNSTDPTPSALLSAAKDAVDACPTANVVIPNSAYMTGTDTDKKNAIEPYVLQAASIAVRDSLNQYNSVYNDIGYDVECTLATNNIPTLAGTAAASDVTVNVKLKSKTDSTATPVTATVTVKVYGGFVDQLSAQTAINAIIESTNSNDEGTIKAAIVTGMPGITVSNLKANGVGSSGFTVTYTYVYGEISGTATYTRSNP